MRQYISQKELDEKGLLTIIGKDYRYMRQVLRLKAGDMLAVRLPSGELKGMTLCKIDEDSKKIILQICAQEIDISELENQPEQVDAENLLEYWLFMFLPKSSKMDLIVRQATECGVARIFPVVSSFSQKGSEKLNFRGERFERIIKEARQQSGSPVNTVVEDCITVQQAGEIWQKQLEECRSAGTEARGCVLYERSEFTTSLSECLKDAKNLKKCAIVCGAEGGISPEEIRLLLESGFKAVHFKTNILRCETAALYGIAALQNIVTENM
ncbi:MAG: 16S rRNA (uracil(1498)-N(3))-methyltransferase [Treponema sp.]|nr:16S rRNA (uracil(1498)-N(3))-methyltransferase [Candidatus Treponema equifaecale]